MKSNKLLYSLVIIVALIVLNLIFFFFLKEYSVARYINIAGANLAIIVFFVAGIISSKDKDNEFLQYTKYPIVIIYSVITFIISILFILFHLKSVNISIVIQVILLAMLIIGVALVKMANNSIINNTNEQKKKTLKITEMSNQLYAFMQDTSSTKIYKILEEAYDEIKNCKINVTQDTSNIDSQIREMISKMKVDADKNDIDTLKVDVKEIRKLIGKRNNY